MTIQYRNSFHLYPSIHDPGKMVTVGQLRDFVDLLNKFNVSNDQTLETCDILIDMAIETADIDTIVCGDCVPGRSDDDASDVIISVHECVRDAAHSKT